MILKDRGYRLIFTKGDPSAIDPVDREDSFQRGRFFRCEFMPLSAEQNIRAGRLSTDKAGRLFFRPFEVDLQAEDRVEVNGVRWKISLRYPAKDIAYVALVEDL